MEFRDCFFRLQNGNDVRGAAIATEKEALTLTPGLVSYIAQAFGGFLEKKLGKPAQELRIGVGRDSRITGPDMASACLRGLQEAQCFDCGIASTPAMFRSCVMAESDFDGAVMITASHLPFNRNGMKFFTKEGALEKKELSAILEGAAALAQETGQEDDLDIIRYGGKTAAGAGETDGQSGSFAEDAQSGPSAAESYDIIDLYSRQIREIILSQTGGISEQPLAGLHIVVDAGNGAAGFFPGKILEPLGADVSGSSFLEPDGMFPNHVPNPENGAAMDAICKSVMENHADLGVIFDCDGDRAAVVLADGTPANRNTLIALLAAIVTEEHPGSTVVTDSVTSDELQEFLEGELGLKHLRYQRGYKNVINKGIELNAAGEDCELAIETSGHGAFKENYFSDDGAYLSVKIISKMAVMKREGKDISSLIKDLKHPAESIEMRYQIEDETGDTRDFKEYGTFVLDGFTDFAKADPRFRIVEPNYEGVRIAFDDEEVKGWLLLRKSLHDPVLPMNVEAQEVGGTDLILARIAPFIEQCRRLKI